MNLDRLDRQLLALLQVDNLATADRLAHSVGLSPSAIARRLRRLRRDGAIISETAILSDQAAGRPLSALVHIQLERHAPREITRLRSALTDHPSVQLLFEISGAFDLLVLAVASDMAHYNAFAETMLAAHPAVRRFESTFVKKRVKATLAYPLDA